MIGPRGGYTIVEVMVVLSITAILFASSVVIFQGQQGKTQLSQSLYNLASQIQSIATQVNSGVFQNPSNSYCVVNGQNNGRPYISGTQSLSQSDCIYLGNALQVTNTNMLEVYPVLGARVVGGQVASSFDSALPEPAVNLVSGKAQFTTGLESALTLPTGQKFTDSITTNQGGNTQANTGMVGFYQDLSGNGSSLALNIRGYPLALTTGVRSTALQTCVEQSSSTCKSPQLNVKKWELCITDGTRNGKVTVSTTPTGVATDVQPDVKTGDCS